MSLYAASTMLTIFTKTIQSCLFLCLFQTKMEDSEAPATKCRKTDICDVNNGREEEEMRNDTFLKGYCVQILEAGIGKVRSELFRKKTSEFGGRLCSSITERPDILVVDEKMTSDRLCRLLGIDEPQRLEGVRVVRSIWLSACIKNKRLVPTVDYELQTDSHISSAKVNSSTSKQSTLSQAEMHKAAQCSSNLSSACPDRDSDADSNYDDSGEEDTETEASAISSETAVQPRRPLPVGSLLQLIGDFC